MVGISVGALRTVDVTILVVRNMTRNMTAIAMLMSSVLIAN